MFVRLFLLPAERRLKAPCVFGRYQGGRVGCGRLHRQGQQLQAVQVPPHMAGDGFGEIRIL